jgi:hypothetical protein
MLKSRDYSSGLAYAHVIDEAFVRAATERALRDVVDCIEVRPIFRVVRSESYDKEPCLLLPLGF